jgi:hypothetical protein
LPAIFQIYTSYRNSPTDALRNIYGPTSSTTTMNTQLASSTSLMNPNLYESKVYNSPAISSNLMTTNTSSTLGLNRTSPIPIRRYSYSGLPSSASINEYMNLPITDNVANISSLISETCQSISRSSNILNRQLSADMALNNPCYTSLSNLIDENISSDIVKYDLLNDLTTTANITPVKFTNFYTQPTIADRIMFAPTATTTSYFNNRVQPLSTTSRLISDDYLLSKPIFSKNYNQFPSTYLNGDLYSSTTVTRPHQIFNSTLTPHHHHYSSNPCLSSTQTPSYNHYPLSNSFNRNYYQSYHQQPFTSRPPSISSLNRYTTYSNNYAGSFNPQPYYRTGSRLDLDNPKNNEIKRQVSFKFDVDQMSFDP